MKIVDLKTYVVDPHGWGGRNWIFVKLVTNDGIEGIGEAFDVPFSPQGVVKLIETTGERFVINTDPFNIESMWRRIYASGYDQHPDVTKMGIISAFEIACWDIIGKAVGQPVYNLLGGRYHEKLRTYTYMYPAPGKNAQRRICSERSPGCGREGGVLPQNGVYGDQVRSCRAGHYPRPPATHGRQPRPVGGRHSCRQGGHRRQVRHHHRHARADDHIERHQAREEIGEVRSPLVRGARAAGEQGRDGQGRRSHEHSRGRGENASLPSTSSGSCSTSTRRASCNSP